MGELVGNFVEELVGDSVGKFVVDGSCRSHSSDALSYIYFLFKVKQLKFCQS